MLGREPPCLISLAKREEEIYKADRDEPFRLIRGVDGGSAWSGEPAAERADVEQGRATR